MKRCTETDSAIMRCPDYPWKCEMCGAYKEPTNADHIRSMTDEELAELLSKPRCENHRFDSDCRRFKADCVACAADWLSQQHKEDT